MSARRVDFRAHPLCHRRLAIFLREVLEPRSFQREKTDHATIPLSCASLAANSRARAQTRNAVS
jgi:hypothetical protein